MPLSNSIDAKHLPAHVAIIMDGNGRWAKAKGLPRTDGHAKGVEVVKRITKEAARIGLKYLTLYTFSTENWNRPPQEVEALMGLILDNLEEEIFMANNIRFRVIGDTERLPEAVRSRLRQCILRTAQNTRMTLVIALSYSARWEIARAAKEIAEERPATVDEQTVCSHLQTTFMPDPDLLIRTGGELRISNFLLWQCAYTELYFTDTFWPDFDEERLQQAIADFQQRQRRYGQTSEQVTNQ